MQGKGLIKFFIIALVVVCLLQLMFSIVAWRVEKNATAYAIDKVLPAGKDTSGLTEAEKDSIEVRMAFHRKRFIDSVSSENVVDLPLLKFTYDEVRKQQIKPGLDLKGGMSVVLQVSVEDIVKGLSGKSKDSTFNKAIDLAREGQSKSQDNFIAIFGREFEKIGGADAKLAAIFNRPENQGFIENNMTNEQVLEALQEQAQATVEMTKNTVQSRIDAYGVVQPNINVQQSTGRIIIEMPGVDNPKDVRELMITTAKLEFWETWQIKEIWPKLIQANEVLVDILGLADTSAAGNDTAQISAADSLLRGLTADVPATDGTVTPDDTLPDTITDDSPGTDPLAITPTDSAGAVKDSAQMQADAMRQNPLFAKLNPPIQGDQFMMSPNDATVGFARPSDRALIDEYLAYEQVRAVFPRNIKFFWGNKANSNGYFALYAIKERENQDGAPLEGDVIRDAFQDTEQKSGISQVVVSMSMNNEGAKKWRKLTKDNSPTATGSKWGNCIAIVMDNRVYSAPEVNTEISDGRSIISGNFSVSEAQSLASVIKAGKLPAPARIIEEEIIGPTLGERSTRAGLISLALGLAAVLLFMLLYYTTSGLIADIAVVVNLFFMLGILASFGAALTLPGMAGIILSLGMAVDANVIINERIREELARGKGIRLAVQDGFKASYSAIIDGNVTTMITGIILLYFGLGPVKGFATTLVIGLVTSFITAVLVSRLIFDWCLAKDYKIKFATKLTEGAFKNSNFQFIKSRKLAYGFSIAIVVIGAVFFVTKGFDLGVDFKGGRNYVVKFDKDVHPEELGSKLEKVFGSYPQVKNYGPKNQASITTAYLIDSATTTADSLVELTLYEGVKGFYTNQPDFEKFHKDNKLSSVKVEPAIADDIKMGAFKAGILAVLGIFIYIYFRFNRKLEYGVGAIAALVFNAMFMLTIYSVFGGLLPFSTEIDQTFIAALLTVLGYSVNDTVVVFDRIREYVGLHPTKDYKSVVNMALNDTLSRTVVTGVTTLLVIVILMIFGGESIRGFCFALFIGIIIGTFSSIFVATPIVVDLHKDKAPAKA